MEEEIKIEGFDVLIRNDGTLFSVSVKQLPGCVSQGKSKDEAIKNIGKAIRLYVTTVAKEQFNEPQDKKKIKTKIAEPKKERGKRNKSR